jgi:hypothetical protein
MDQTGTTAQIRGRDKTAIRCHADQRTNEMQRV